MSECNQHEHEYNQRVNTINAVRYYQREYYQRLSQDSHTAPKEEGPARGGVQVMPSPFVGALKLRHGSRQCR